MLFWYFSSACLPFAVYNLLFHRDDGAARKKWQRKALLYMAWLRIKTLFNIARHLWSRICLAKENCLSSINKLNALNLLSSAKRFRIADEIYVADEME